MCTTEFLIAGLLPQMADDFGVRPSRIGLLIMAFAVGMIVGAPVMALATLRLPKRATLVLALATFAAGHVIAALSGSFELLFVARVLTGVVTGAFWSAATVVATRAAGPDASTRALGVIGSGVALATVLGVPLGSLAGDAPRLARRVLGARRARRRRRGRDRALHARRGDRHGGVRPLRAAGAAQRPPVAGPGRPPFWSWAGAWARSASSRRCSPSGPASRSGSCRWSSSASASGR